MTGDKLRKGDEVSWRSHGAMVEGEVVEEITEDTEPQAAQFAQQRTIRSTGCAATTAARTPFTSRAHCESDDRTVTVALALFTRDLGVHDNPVLYAAAQSADCVVPLFVLDERILASSYNRPNRARTLADSLADLRQADRLD